MLINYNKNIYLIVYVFVLLIELYGIFIQKNILELISKPFLTITLLVMYIRKANTKSNKYIIILVLLAFIDFALIYRDNTIFLSLAMIFLILTHLIYIKILYKNNRAISFYRFSIYFIPFLICLSVIFLVIKDQIGSLLYLSLFHIFLLFIVTNIVFLNYLQKNKKSSLTLFWGFFILIFANFLFAFNIFLNMGVNILIISTLLYAVAQYMICIAMINNVSST